MEQESDENGLQNLNPMYLWKFVRMDKTRNTPRVLVQVARNPKIFDIAEQNHEWEFVILSNNDWEDPRFPNVKLLWADSLAGERLYRIYASADIILTEIDKPEKWLPAMFCGVTPLYSLEQLSKALENPQVLPIVSRIENWETAQNTLTFLTTSAIKEL